MSVRSRTGVLGKGTPRVPPGGDGGAGFATDYVSRPEGATALGDQAQAATSNYQGGSYFLERPVRFDRFTFSIASRTDPYTGNIAIYQAPDGVIVPDPVLIADVTFSDIAPGRVTLALNGGITAELEVGVYWVIWGQRSGAGGFSLNVYNMGTSGVINTAPLLAAGDHGVNFSTTESAGGVTPATFDPLEGGTSGVSGDGSDRTIIFRLQTA